MEMLQLIETLRSGDASVAKLFGDAGRSARRRGQDGAYLTRVAECAEFLQQIYSGSRPMYHLQEAMTTSDFPLLFGDVLDRQALGYYQETPATWTNWCKRATVSDFRSVKRFAIDGNEAVLPKVLEQAPYTEAKLAETPYTYSVAKYGRRIPFSWEAIVNDDLDLLKNMPARFGRAARRSEEKFATQLAFGTTGPDTTFFSAGNKNIINSTNSGGPFTGVNPPLSIPGLAQGFLVLANMKDADGEPIDIEAVELVVGPALKVTATNIMNATQLLVGSFGQSVTAGEGSGASQNYQMFTENWMRNNVRLSINRYIPVVCSSSNGNTSWMLVASPSAGRPAFEIGFLRGHEAPEIFIKESNARSVGGGATDPMNGDFDTDSIEYKIRHVFGGCQLDPKCAVASNGSGS